EGFQSAVVMWSLLLFTALVFVSGSRPEMGHWDPCRFCPPVNPVLSLAQPHTDKLWCKFIKRELGVKAVMNFQTEWDVLNNSHGCRHDLSQPMTPETLYKDCELLLLNISTIVILPSAGRTQMLPQVVFLLCGLLENGHTVYVHCNAGVGRSTAAMCGLLITTYIDEEALVRAENYFLMTFG
uniref:EPM2A glucan phosphatase, laforin n=1 Tax=Cyprinus carpio TaxID=7962 RepID=A0A8C1UGS5_CYPCA